ncbi:MAG TPA: SURF1 family protein [Sphingomicrobium sp.]|nr:SURF1 family protein [Sphingomicrobium sp.]
MTRGIPVVATMVVALAVATMIALGFWQIRRSHWKDQLIDQYRAAETLPPIAFPTAPFEGPLPLFRWATGNCLKPAETRASAGENRDGEAGYVHIVHCATGAEGPGMAVELGWSRDPNAKWQWTGGPVTGMIAPDRHSRIRLVAASAPPGLQPSAMPSLRSIPNNHRSYAVQWFLFAAIALVIYILALSKRFRAG